MKISSKNKKIIIGITVAVGLLTFCISGLDNAARNAEVEAKSTPLNIQNAILQDEKILVEINDNISKSNLEEAKIIDMKGILKTIKDTDYVKDTDVNNHIKQLDDFNRKLDKMIDVYYKDENLNKDIVFTDKVDQILGLNSFIDDQMYRFNTQSLDKFNNSIKKFPINLTTKSRGWVELNKFTSINQ